MMFHQGIDPGLRNEPGVCLARTPDIKRASSWTLWTNHGWVDGLKNLCDPISEQNIGDMHSSITFNTYLGKYLLVGSKYYPFDGVYISTSEDLVHWAKAVKILSLKDARIQQGDVKLSCPFSILPIRAGTSNIQARHLISTWSCSMMMRTASI